jgi:hypothetical protein
VLQIKHSNFIKGNQITCIEEVVNQEFIIWHEKVYHRGWFMRWQTSWLVRQLYLGRLYQANKIEVKSND